MDTERVSDETLDAAKRILEGFFSRKDSEAVANALLQSRRAAQPAGEVERLREALKAFVDYHDRLAGMSADQLLFGDGTSEPELRERGRAALNHPGRVK